MPAEWLLLSWLPTKCLLLSWLPAESRLLRRLPAKPRLASEATLPPKRSLLQRLSAAVLLLANAPAKGRGGHLATGIRRAGSTVKPTPAKAILLEGGRSSNFGGIHGRAAGNGNFLFGFLDA